MRSKVKVLTNLGAVSSGGVAAFFSVVFSSSSGGGVGRFFSLVLGSASGSSRGRFVAPTAAAPTRPGISPGTKASLTVRSPSLRFRPPFSWSESESRRCDEGNRGASRTFSGTVFPDSDTKDAEAAVAGVRAGWHEWAARTPEQRGAVLERALGALLKDGQVRRADGRYALLRGV